jgi:hypothetical protein
LSNLIAAWQNNTMPFGRMIQGLGVLGAETVEVTVTAKGRNGDYTRTLNVPVPISMHQAFTSDGTEFSVSFVDHQAIMDDVAAETPTSEEESFEEDTLF